MKSGAQQLLAAMLPGVDFNEITKAANGIGIKVQEMEARTIRMESMLNEMMIQLTLITNNTLPVDHAGEIDAGFCAMVRAQNGLEN